MDEPDTWEWPAKFGYTKQEEELAWQHIDTHPQWWLHLAVYPDANVPLVDYAAAGHALYFITARRGAHVQYVTTEWLALNYKIQAAVILTKQKGLFCKSLGIDAFIDDKPEMAIDVKLHSSRTRVHLRKRPHNVSVQTTLLKSNILLTDSVATFLDYELQRLR